MSCRPVGSAVQVPPESSVALPGAYVKKRLPWELLCADDLVVVAESEEELIKKLSRWKDVRSKV